MWSQALNRGALSVAGQLVGLAQRMLDVARTVREGYDLDIRIGDHIAPNLIAKLLANNARVLCARPPTRPSAPSSTPACSPAVGATRPTAPSMGTPPPPSTLQNGDRKSVV